MFCTPRLLPAFMVMPDAIKSLLSLWAAPREALSRYVYNVTSFSISAQEIIDLVGEAFPDSIVECVPHTARQAIVDTWPADIDDSAARQDWGWQPDYDVSRSFEEYLIPTIRAHYKQAV
jgi:threonine 3-dehydrogenase